MRKIKFVTVLTCLLLATFVVPVSAQGQPPVQPWTNKGVEIRPDLGATIPGLEPGANGYKVFNPGAIKTVAIQSIDNSAQSLLAATVYRSGSTDVWGNCCWTFSGGHTSGSDIFEAEIWADGYLKYKKDTAWRDSCRDRSSGWAASCNTTFDGWYSLLNPAYGRTNHHFHTSGYVDQNFTTSDTY